MWTCPSARICPWAIALKVSSRTVLRLARTFNPGYCSSMLLRIIALGLFLTLVLFGQSSHTVTKADFDKWMTQLSNWGRWGKDDQRGTVNLITPAKVKQAATLAKQGITVSLEHPLMTESAADNTN